MNVRARIGIGLAACLLASGCTSTLHKQAGAFSSATAPVVDAAAQAYKDANAIHDLRVNYDAAVDFDKTDKVYNPRAIKPLLSERAIDVRLAMLKALQLYVKNINALTTGTGSKELDGASSSLAGSITGLGNLFLPPGSSSSTETISVTAGGQTSTETETVTSPTGAISTGQQNAIATGLNALGQYLGSRKVKKELPAIIIKMDPAIEQMCSAMAKDVDALKSAEGIDFNFMINQQTLFLRENKQMDAGERRALIMKLPEIVRKHQAADEQLDDLKAGLVKVQMTHHALAAEAQGNNPESLKTKIGELSAAGESLGKYYSSLPAQ
ncbi:MAG TPA: hypothetical protein VIM62_01250 [Acidobacteriaceae bacterium]